jgi:hypothetical protein
MQEGSGLKSNHDITTRLQSNSGSFYGAFHYIDTQKSISIAILIKVDESFFQFLFFYKVGSIIIFKRRGFIF